MTYRPTTEEDRVAAAIVDAGYQVHKELGPGLLESAYEECLAFELAERGLGVRRQVAMPIEYKSVQLDAGYRIDLIVRSLVVVEIKAIEQIHRVHQAQLMTYEAFGLPRRLSDELHRHPIQEWCPTRRRLGVKRRTCRICRHSGREAPSGL